MEGYNRGLMEGYNRIVAFVGLMIVLVVAGGVLLIMRASESKPEPASLVGAVMNPRTVWNVVHDEHLWVVFVDAGIAHHPDCPKEK